MINIALSILNLNVVPQLSRKKVEQALEACTTEIRKTDLIKPLKSISKEVNRSKLTSQSQSI